MADRRISQLPVVTDPNGAADVLPVVSGGVTSQVTVNNIVKAGLRPASNSVLGGVLVGSGLEVTPLGLLTATQTGTLEGLADVQITGIVNGQHIRYDGSKWVNTNVLDGGNV